MVVRQTEDHLCYLKKTTQIIRIWDEDTMECIYSYLRERCFLFPVGVPYNLVQDILGQMYITRTSNSKLNCHVFKLPLRI